jgi:undecaprenyl-diphosphatase
LIFNGLVLIFSKKIKIESQKIENLKPLNAFFIGLAQAFAILPGLSRSGMTIVAGLKQGLSSFEAAKFSFYMSIPIVAGAGFIPLMKIKSTAINYDFLLPLFASMIITTIIGFMSLKLLFRIIRETRLNYFGYYTLFLGLAGLLFYILYP